MYFHEIPIYNTELWPFEKNVGNPSCCSLAFVSLNNKIVISVALK
jgi:hypothetical protein